MVTLELKVKRVRDGASLPEYATAGSAALDLRYCGDTSITLSVGEIESIPTGIAIQVPDGCAAVVCARSGLATKRGISLANGIGLIDPDYRGELCVALKNHGSSLFTVHPGDRIAQLMIIPIYMAKLIEVDELDETARGVGGFGSTGIK